MSLQVKYDKILGAVRESDVPISGTYAPDDATFVTLSNNATLTNERVLTGTANQVSITDNGANSTVVLSTPQNIDTGATPTFAGLTLTGAIGLSAGSVSTPSLAFADNLDTGIYEPTTGSSGNMGFTINGTEFLRVNSNQSWGWHGTAAATTSVHTMTIAPTGLVTGKFMTVSFTAAASISPFYAVLDFTATASAVKQIRTGMFTAVGGVAAFNNQAISALYSVPGFNSSGTVTSGTTDVIGHNFVPSNPTAGNFTGGTVNIIGHLTPANSPANYTGGATINYYSVLARGGYISMGGASGNTLQYTNNTAAPGTTATPAFTAYYGGNTNAMGDPVGWLIVNVGGTDQKIPYY